MLTFKKSESKDLVEILKLIESAKIALHRASVDQWQNGKPDESSILLDINNEESYGLFENEKLVASCMVSKRFEPTYESIEGRWNTPDENIMVVHRFVVDQSKVRKGYGSILLESIENCFDCCGIRIDTHKDNIAMRKLLEKNGFNICGEIQLFDGSLRVAYDKIITSTKKEVVYEI